MKAGFDIFQSFEMQFMRVTTSLGPQKAMQKLAQDAVNRAIDYYKQKEDAFITEAVTLGQSKIESVWGIPIPFGKTPGFEIKYRYGSSEKEWITASLYEKVGLVIERKTPMELPKYYKKKDGKSRTTKYGYRRLLRWENRDQLTKEYKDDSLIESESGQFADYPYMLDLKDLEEKSKSILEKINSDDKSLEEERMKEVIKEVKDDIIEGIKVLVRQSHEEDHRSLANMETNLKNLKVDEYLKRFEQHFEEAKQERQEIAKSVNEVKQIAEETGKNIGEIKQGVQTLLGRQQVKDKEPVWFDVKKPVDLFTGRKQELSDLHNRIQRSSEKVTVISQMTSISGLGGIGKTELARQYIQEHSKNHYDNNVIWVNAESEATLIESFYRLAKDKLRISTKDADGKEKDIKSIVEEVYKFFNKRKSLFIFDNAEKNNDLNKFLPLRSLTPDANKPYVLITSRNREWERGIEVMDLSELELGDAIEFVKKGLSIPQEDKSQDQEIESLVKKLQRFPLAIQQAIAYIEDQRVTGEFGISDYLKEYEKKTEDLLKSEVFRGIDNDYAKTTFTTWKITIDKIAGDKQHGQLALKILDAVAYFAPENINREMFLSLAGGNEEQLKSAVRLLVKYSMVNGEQKQNILSIHRLVQEVVRLELKGQGKEEENLKEVLKLVKPNLKKENLDHAVSVWSYASKHEELVKEFSKLPAQITGELNDAGRYQEAYLFGRKALESLKGILDPDNLDTLATQHNMASVLDKQGKYDEALQIYQEVYGKSKDVLRPDNPNTLGTRINMAVVLDKQGKYEEALQAYQEVFDIQKRPDILGPDHPDTLTTHNNMAVVLCRQGKYEEALQIFHKVYEKRKDVLVSDHPSTLNTRNNMALVLSNQGQYEEALQAYQEVFDIQKRPNVLGPDHPDTLRTRHNIAGVLDKQGKYKEALQAFQEVFDIQKRPDILGPDHPDTLSTRMGMAGVLYKQGKYDEALQAFQEVFNIQKRPDILGPDHPDTLSTRHNIAGVLCNQGQYEEALQAFQEVFDIQKRPDILGPDHPDTLRTRHNIAGVLDKQGKYDEALQAFQEVFDIRKRPDILGPDHPDTLSTRHNIAGVLCNQGQYEEALQAFQEVFDIQKRPDILGPDHPDTLRTRHNIAGVLDKQGKYDEALQAFQEVFDIRKRPDILGPDHPDTLSTRMGMAGVLYKQGKYDEALQAFQEVFDIQKRPDILGPDHPDTLSTRHNIARVLDKQGKYDEALQAFQEVFDIQKRPDILGLDHPDTLSTRMGIAGVLDKQGKYEKAFQIYQEIYEKRGIDINAPDKDGMTPLHLAAKKGYTKVVNVLLDKIKDNSEGLNRLLFDTEEYGMTPLHYAALHNHIEIVDTLLSRMRNNPKNLKKLVFDQADRVNEIDFNDRSSVVKLLLERAAEAFLKNKHHTVLHEAISGNKEEIIGLILDKIKETKKDIDQYINAKDTEGDTPLMWAAQSGRTDSTKILLEYGAGLNVQNNDGETALHWAAKGGYQEIVLLLLDKQADPNIKDNSEKTPLDLAQEKLAQDPENENLKTITGLLLSITDESKSQHQEKQVSGSVSLEECLPATSSERGNSGDRRKREAKAGECELLWEDVDEFNEEKEEVRDFSKIKINSGEFIDYIKNTPMSETKLAQLVQLADKVQVTGKFQGLVNNLISNQKIINHLSRVGRVSGMVMHGMMAKNVLAAFLNGDGEGVAINLGFIAGGQGFARVAQAASVKGAGLVLDGKLMLGRSLKAASPFLARGTSAFIAYDLVNQIKAFKNGTEEALVGVIGDSIYLGVDAAEVGIEIAEAFEIFEGVSSITGPIGATIGAVVFVGTDVYLAVKRVDKIDEIIHLTTKERFIEGLRAFVGMRSESYVEELMQEKEVNNQLVTQGLEYLKQHDNIQRYVFPTGKSVIDSCSTVQYRERCLPTGLNVCYEDELGNLFTIKKREKCTTKLQIDLNNKVLLDKKRTDIKWSRARPSDFGAGEFLCLPQGNDESVPSNGTYLCENAIGIEYANNRTGSNTLISLGNGDDVVVGFPQDNHIVILGDGHKNITLGDGNDTFLLEGNNITGVIYGGNGTNTLDLEHFVQEEKSIQISLSKIFEYVYHKKDNNVSYLLGIHGINDVLLRRDKQDYVHTTCNTRYVDGRSGEDNNNTDNIIIPYDNSCSYEIKLVVRPYTNIKNYAINGNFTYIVPMANKGEASVNLVAHTNPQSNHRFVFSNTLYDVNNIEKINNTVSFSFIQNVGYLRLVPKSINTRYTTDYEFNITNNAASNALYELNDNTEIKVGERNIYAIQSTNKSVDEIISDYPTIANNLKMSIFVQSLSSNETVAIGHGNHDVLHNDPYYKSHLVGNGGENIFVVTSGDEALDNNKLPIPEVVIYDLDKENLIDTLDLRQIKQQVVKDLGKEVKAKTLINNKDLLIELLCFRENQVEESVVRVRLKDALVTNWYERLHVIVDNVPMKIEEFELKPLPLIFDEGDKNIIVIGPQDIEEENKVVVSKEIGNYIFARSGNNLIITNAFDRNLTSNEFCTISLSKFYQEAKMRTLDIKFADKEIILKDHQEQISAARDIDVVKKEHKDQVYDDVFNHTRSESSEVNETTIHEIRHRDEYLNVTEHQRSRRAINEKEIPITSSKVSANDDLEFFVAQNNATFVMGNNGISSAATRIGSGINDLFGWVKSSIGGLFNSRAALPENNTTQSSISQVDAQVSVDGTIMLLDLLIRKVTGQKHIPLAGESISLLEAQGYALNITTKFEQVLNETAIKSGISATNLNFNPVAVQSTLAGQIKNGKFSEMLETLYSSAKKACPEFKQTDKFLASLANHLEEVVAEKEVELLVGKQKGLSKANRLVEKSVPQVKVDNKPNTFLNDTSTSKQLSYVERVRGESSGVKAGVRVG